jgi:alpha-L-fucosidase
MAAKADKCNSATAANAYMNATTIISYLVDIVSKNGNFLLDIGPRADGSIVETESSNLRDAGKWIHAHAEAIFNTSYWFVQPEVAESNLRFTQASEAFYVLALDKPMNGSLFVDAPVPILEGDKISMVGLTNATAVLDWSKHSDGTLTIYVPERYVEMDEYCWVFKIKYLV